MHSATYVAQESSEDLPVSGSGTSDEYAGSSNDELIPQDESSSSMQTEELSLEWIKHIPLFEYRKSNKSGCEEYSTIKELLKVLQV